MKKPRISRRATVNLMLYLGVLAMAMITWYDYRERQDDTSNFTALLIDDVQHISVQRSGYSDIVIARREGQWQITAPVTRSADDSRVVALLDLGRRDASVAYSVNEVDLAELGLDDPLATVIFSGEKNLSVQLGGLGPNNRRRYLRIDQRVWLSDDVYMPLLQGGLRAFANLLLAPGDGTIEEVTFDGSDVRDDAAVLLAWQTTAAVDIVPNTAVEPGKARQVTVHSSDSTLSTYQFVRSGEQWLLLPQGADFALLLSQSQGLALGLR